MATIQERQSQEWSPARIFLAASAAYHLFLGAIGLAIDQTFPLSSVEAARLHSEHIFGIFETNGWHSLAAVLLGLVSLYFAVRPRYAREAALYVGLSQLGVVVTFTVWAPETFLFASNGADQWIHSLTTIGGVTGWLLTPNDRRTMSDAAAPA